MDLTNLQVGGACTVLRLAQVTGDGTPLVDQAGPYLENSSNLLLDADDMIFSSLQLGELVNLAQEFDKRWDGTSHCFGMINLPGTAKRILEETGLDKVFKPFDSLSEAMKYFAADSSQR